MVEVWEIGVLVFGGIGRRLWRLMAAVESLSRSC